MVRRPFEAAVRGALALGLAAVLTPGAARAADAWYSPKSDGKWEVRLRGIAVIPDDSLSVSGVPGGAASISSSFVPEVDFTYFFTPNLAAELILGTTPHDVTGRGAIAGADIGSVWLLPPTLTAQYHFTRLGEWTGTPALSKVRPYIGAGVNYTMFYNEDAGQFRDIEYDDAFGWAFQAGVDVEIAEGLFLNADVKYILLDTDWSINHGELRGKVDINPLIVGVGLGYRF
ncbi:OmpW family protein [Paroceanicella profunda]|uniref:OmpW family protein n=1 Tax=Paroceanicella profunda TaxID=2579971 RepID=A0A5B8G3S4_9RHOB|nr:OmpW family protein [Paroceanicella profunda]QDL93463.1 OmpW family protein [Paroceanicella profunda]